MSEFIPDLGEVLDEDHIHNLIFRKPAEWKEGTYDKVKVLSADRVYLSVGMTVYWYNHFSRAIVETTVQNNEEVGVPFSMIAEPKIMSVWIGKWMDCMDIYVDRAKLAAKRGIV